MRPPPPPPYPPPPPPYPPPPPPYPPPPHHPHPPPHHPPHPQPVGRAQRQGNLWCAQPLDASLTMRGSPIKQLTHRTRPKKSLTLKIVMYQKMVPPLGSPSRKPKIALPPAPSPLYRLLRLKWKPQNRRAKNSLLPVFPLCSRLQWLCLAIAKIQL